MGLCWYTSVLYIVCSQFHPPLCHSQAGCANYSYMSAQLPVIADSTWLSHDSRTTAHHEQES